MKPIIDDIQESIKIACQNPADYEGYVENCLLFDTAAGAEYYECTPKQFEYCCRRALLSI